MEKTNGLERAMGQGATYVTPRNIAMAISNAIMEIRAAEGATNSVLSDEQQINIIAYHCNDYQSGRLSVELMNAMIKKLTVKELMGRLCTDHDSEEKLQSVLNERKAA